MSLEQIKEYGEKLTDFIFTKYITTMHAQALGGHAEKGKDLKHDVYCQYG